MNSQRATSKPPASDADTVSLISRIDASTVTVGTQPDATGTGRVVLLRIQSPMLDVLAASFLRADEAHLLAAALSTAALAAAGRDMGGPGGPAPAHDHHSGRHDTDDDYAEDDGWPGAERRDAPSHPRDQHVVRAAEGITAAVLCHALAAVPPHSRLIDFASDTDVTLVFARATAGTPAGDPPGTNGAS